MKFLEIILAALNNSKHPFLIGVSIASCILLGVKDPQAQWLGVLEFRKENHTYIGVLFLFSSCILVGHLMWWLIGIIKIKIGNRKIILLNNLSLQELTPEEKAYLLPYIDDQITVQRFHQYDGIAGGLLSKDILFISSNHFDFREGISYGINPWAKRILIKTPELLKGAVAPRKEGNTW